METRAVDKPKATRPTLFDGGWMEKFFNAPLDEFFNFGTGLSLHTKTAASFRVAVAIRR